MESGDALCRLLGLLQFLSILMFLVITREIRGRRGKMHSKSVRTREIRVKQTLVDENCSVMSERCKGKEWK